MSPYTSNAEVIALAALHDFVPDGVLSKAAWTHAHWLDFDHDMSGQPNYPQSRTRVAVAWTPGNLYLAYRCTYTVLNVYEGDPSKKLVGLWNRDVVEAFINPQPERVNHYYEFEVAPNNLWIDLEINIGKTPFNDPGWESHYQHATRIEAAKHEWTCEMRIPARSLGVEAIRAGDEWRINFFRADGPGPDTGRRFLAWSTIPEGRTFHVPRRFGIVRFEGSESARRG